MKKGLIIYYSQIGQTAMAVDSFLKGSSEFQWDRVEVKPIKPVVFPYKVSPFFRLFPLCVTNKAAEIKPLQLDTEKEYDVIVVAYQIWFLSASLPMQAVFKDETFKKLIVGKNVLNIVTCRNMWVSAVGKVNTILKNLGAKAIKTQVLCDLAPPWATFVTTPRWMLTGKRDAFGVFPQAGIADKDFQLSERLGRDLAQTGYDAVDVRPISHRQTYSAVLMEKMGYPLFPLWGHCIESLAPKENLLKDLMLLLFRLCLVATILALLPIAALMTVATSKLLGKRMNHFLDKLLQG